MKLKDYHRFVDNVSDSKILSEELKLNLIKIGAIVFVADACGIDMQDKLSKLINKEVQYEYNNYYF